MEKVPIIRHRSRVAGATPDGAGGVDPSSLGDDDAAISPRDDDPSTPSRR